MRHACSDRSRMLRQRHGGLVLVGGAFVLVALITRIALLVKSASAVTWKRLV